MGGAPGRRAALNRVALRRDALVLAGHPLAGLALSTPAAYKQRVWTPSRLKPELVL
ncbi:hypothetical protein GCM10018963_41660 [Saccharothrix longispora]